MAQLEVTITASTTTTIDLEDLMDMTLRDYIDNYVEFDDYEVEE